MFDLDYRKKFILHFLLATLLGFTLRSLSSYFSFGAQSLDDYTHGIIPALEWIQGKAIQIPDWRSPLLVWSLGAFLKIGNLIGVESVFSQIQWMLFSLGAFSTLLVLIYGHYVNKYLLTEKNKSFFIFSSYILNLHPLLIFSQTRAFGESIAMIFLFICFSLFFSFNYECRNKPQISREQHIIFFVGWLLLGASCLFRFQVGVIAVAVFVYFLVSSLNKKKWLLLLNMFLACLIVLILCVCIDLLFNRKPFGTLQSYLLINQDVGSKHTNQPWWNTWLTFLGMFFIPLTLPFLKKLKALSKAENFMLILCFIFVFAHSIIAHKEERFLYPILPFIVLIFARIWFESLNTFYEKVIFRPLMFLFTTLGLILVVFSNSQAGEFETYRKLEKVNTEIYIWEQESLISEAYFRPKFIELLSEKNKIFYNETKVNPSMQEIVEIKKNWNYLLFSANTQNELNKNIALAQQQGFACESAQNMQSFGDKIIYKLNPKVNIRRKPVWVSLCQNHLQ